MRRIKLPKSTFFLLALGGCVKQLELGDEGAAASEESTTGDPGATVTTAPLDTSATVFEPTSTTEDPPAVGCTLDAPCKLDILVVMDNSDDTADLQRNVARSLIDLVEGLQHHEPGAEVPVDVQIMFTSTDVGSELCAPFQPPTYTPALGGPVSSGCNDRLADFTGLGNSPKVREDACTDLCPVDVVPADPFIAFFGADSNVPDVPAVDLDGDEDLDSPVAQAAACLAPQGIAGCGYEAPLAAMARALDPTQPWNNGPRPFLREGSAVTVILVSPETECSIDDAEALLDPQYHEVNPSTNQPELSSAACWHAGMDCADPEEHELCAHADEPLAPISRYENLLNTRLLEIEGREVSMVAIAGVPLVTERTEHPPHAPSGGGVYDLSYRGWTDLPYPDGDILPSDAAAGIDAAQLEFRYGIAPGCSAVDGVTGTELRGMPSPRLIDTCRSLNRQATGPNDIEEFCCVESVCDPQPSLGCVEGWITQDWTLDD